MPAVGGDLDRPVCNAAVAMIACVVDPRSVYHGLAFAAEDCAACVENMLLVITALGYASVWLDGVLRRDDKAARVGRLLGVPEGKDVRIVLPLGVPAEPAVQEKNFPSPNVRGSITTEDKSDAIARPCVCPVLADPASGTGHEKAEEHVKLAGTKHKAMWVRQNLLDPKPHDCRFPSFSAESPRTNCWRSGRRRRRAGGSTPHVRNTPSHGLI